LDFAGGMIDSRFEGGQPVAAFAIAVVKLLTDVCQFAADGHEFFSLASQLGFACQKLLFPRSQFPGCLLNAGRWSCGRAILALLILPAGACFLKLLLDLVAP